MNRPAKTARLSGTPRRALFLGLRATLLPLALRRLLQRSRATILAYHDVEPAVADVHFRELKRRYNPIALSDLVLALRRGALAELPRRSVVITFDDGHKRNRELGEVIRRHKIPVTIFLTSGVAGTNRRFWFRHPLDPSVRQHVKSLNDEERLRMLADQGFFETEEYPERDALDDREIRDLAELVDFQAHTIFHPCLPRCTDEKAWREMAGCRRDLESRYGRRIYAIAYPNGDWSDRERTIASRAGYACALTTDPGYVSGGSEIFALPRFVVEDDAPVSELVVTASGVWGHLYPALKRIASGGFVEGWRRTRRLEPASK